ncbi:MAG TPA: 6-hydroxymethylpterin diphosphokinase MptE-like protein [Phycisphaerae bacterium]|nr:6-hydroxymethylpterin diphosphokinase MptE-like protein [Phycisphaerae bacterium]
MTDAAALAAAPDTPAPFLTDAHATYVRNLSALFQTDARLAMAIDAVHPADVPVLETAKDGYPTVRVMTTPPAQSGPGPLAAPTGGGGPGGRQVYLHSRYRPLHEAENWAAAVACEDRYVVAVSGFGLGHHIRALLDRMPHDALLIVAEPNLPLLKAALSVADLAEPLRTARLLIFTSLDRGHLVDRLEPRSVLFTAGAGTLFAAHPASIQADAAGFFSAFQKLITEFVSFTRTGFLTLMLNNVATCRNVANNIGRYATTPTLDLLQNAYPNVPAILVAAGPSLQKNMHLLHEIKGDQDGRGRKAVIIAVQTMLKPLLAAGIEPDFVTSLDYNTVSTRFFENLEESAGGPLHRLHLVAEAKANWNVLDTFSGSGGGGGITLLHNDFAAKLLRDAFPTRAGLKAGATVAHLSFYLAEFLGCNPIILIGQDLGFVDGLYYKPGTAIHETWSPELSRFNTLETKEWERIARSKTILRKIPDIHGHPMYTEEQFFVYLQQFERDFAASRHTVIDATEGGAKKQHVTRMTLRDAIDQYCQLPITSYPLPANAPWKAWTTDQPRALETTIAALESRRLSAADMKETCERTIPLLHEMIEKQTDPAAMHRLFAEIDRQRAKVNTDPQTFDMVVFLNTIGELRRFNADLSVKTAKADSLDRQKRQLLRDIDYVQNLQTGAERLLAVLDEALARLHRQRDALQQNKPWPREVAGAAR